MTLTELRYIVAVAEHRHFGNAAEACFVSQPTLSVAVRKLEEELGVRLFERSRSDVIVTPVGERIVAQAEAVLREAQAVVEIAEATRDPLGTQLTLGVIYTVGPFLVPKLITSLKAQAPKLGLVIRENFTDALVKALRSGEIDAAVMSLPLEEKGLVSRPLYEEPFQVALPREHPLAAQDSIAPKALRAERVLLLGARNCFRDQVVEACPGCIAGAAEDGALNRALEGSSLDTICQMVATGAGVTVLPATMRLSEDLREHVVLRPFAAPAPSRTVAVFYRRGFARPELINCLATATREARLPGVTHCA